VRQLEAAFFRDAGSVRAAGSGASWELSARRRSCAERVWCGIRARVESWLLFQERFGRTAKVLRAADLEREAGFVPAV
jgi:hypothetical protein